MVVLIFKRITLIKEKRILEMINIGKSGVKRKALLIMMGV